MASKSQLRVCVKTGNQTSRLFSISERQNGDLVINIKSATSMRDFGSIESSFQPNIVNQKYSIHCSNQSEKNINAIVHRIKLDNGEEITTQNYTKALKQNNKYVVIYSARSPNLSNERYKIDSEERKTITLSEYDSKKLSFYYMVSICNYKTKEIKSKKDFSCKYIKFTNFKVLIMWSFQTIPSHSSGTKCHFLTMNPNDFPTENRSQLKEAEGFSCIKLVSMFRRLREHKKQELKLILIKEIPEALGDIDFLFSLPFNSKPVH